jgi:hypothetical protein
MSRKFMTLTKALVGGNFQLIIFFDKYEFFVDITSPKALDFFLIINIRFKFFLDLYKIFGGGWGGGGGGFAFWCMICITRGIPPA